MVDNSLLKGAVTVCLAVIVVSCAAVTRYTLYLDADSFFSEEEKNLRLIVPEDFGISIYLFPSIYTDYTDTGPDEESKKGIEYSYSSLNIPDGGELTFRLEASVSLNNLDDIKTIPSLTIDLFGAALDAEDLYQEGMLLDSISSNPIGPAEAITLTLITELTDGDFGYELITSGQVRLGLRNRIEPASTGGDVEILYALHTLEMEFNARPFGLLP